MRPLRSARSIGSPKETGLGPRPSTRAGVDAVEAGVGVLGVVGGRVETIVTATVDAGAGVTDAAERVLVGVANDESSSLQDDSAAVPTTAMATDAIKRPAPGTPLELESRV
jgi:hypothetical protein